MDKRSCHPSFPEKGQRQERDEPAVSILLVGFPCITELPNQVCPEDAEQGDRQPDAQDVAAGVHSFGASALLLLELLMNQEPPPHPTFGHPLLHWGRGMG